MNGDDADGHDVGSTAHGAIRSYYDALRDGDPLGPFFANDEDLVKVGISERLVGGQTVRDGLAEQTATTSGWTVDSRDLRVTERDDHAWFSDDVLMCWTGSDPPIRYEFDTRWSGTLERRDEDGELAIGGQWRFVGMHVSTAGDL
jgi:hypothetical protein